MWSHCMFCNGGPGRNEVVETFPIGRRLAFDPARGRLWVVCRRCERWNLTPLEERWEAIETYKRLFRETRLRVSMEQVGLARLREGLELVRIGAPRRPEFAAWRYGDQFGRRRKRALIVGAGVVSVAGVAGVAALAAGVVSETLLAQSGNFYTLYAQYRTVARLRTAEGKVLEVKEVHLDRARFEQREGGGFDLTVEHTLGTTTIIGEEAPRVAGRLMARANRSGAKRAVVDDAVQRIEEAREPGPPGPSHPAGGGDGAPRGARAPGAGGRAFPPGTGLDGGGGSGRHFRQPPPPRGDGVAAGEDAAR